MDVHRRHPRSAAKAFLARAVTEEAEGVDVEAIVDDLKAKVRYRR